MGTSSFPKELWNCWRDITVAYNELARRENVDTGELYVVDALWDAEEGLTQREICEICDMGKQTVSAICKRLHIQTDVHAWQSEGDKRAKVMKLTAAGREKWSVIIGRVRECESRACAGISEDEGEIFLRVCKQYAASLRNEAER